MNLENDSHIRLLLSRLLWPSPLVQERACRALASLLRDEAQAKTTWHHLSGWMKERTLEMDSVAGLLVLARVTVEEGGLLALFPNRPAPQSASLIAAPSLPPIAEVVESLRYPSLMSWLLLRDIYRCPELLIEESQTSGFDLHSGEPPTEFKPSFFFGRYCTQYLPQVFNHLAEQMEKDGRPFKRQWAFEWQQVVERAGIERNDISLNFWLSGYNGKEYHAAALPRMAQVFRSALLRTLAWAHENGILGAGDVFGITAKMRLVDLELWAIEPASRPQWWPREAGELVIPPVSEPQPESSATPWNAVQPKTLNRAPTDVWRQVEELWEKSSNFDAFGELLINQELVPENSWQLMAAQGPVVQGNSFYFLEIVGFFQRCVGPETPDAEEIARWLAGGTEPEDFVTTQEQLTQATGFQVWGNDGSPLRCCGNIKPEEGEGRRFEDWEMMSGARTCQIWAQMPWQFWRQRPWFWLPAPVLLPSPTGNERITFGCESIGNGESESTHARAIVVRVGERVLGHCLDWTDGLRETTVGNLPSLTGQRLLVPKSIVKDFEEQSESTLCWLCRVTGYVRESGYELFKTWSESRILGASLVARPSSNLSEISLDPDRFYELLRGFEN